MYAPNDPRAALASAKAAAPMPARFAAADIGLFYEQPPQQSAPSSRTWLLRGQNFVVAHSEAKPGASFARQGQLDEYVVLVQRRADPVTVEAGGASASVASHSLIIVPPGDSVVTLPEGGSITKIFSARSADLAAQASNATSYAELRAG